MKATEYAKKYQHRFSHTMDQKSWAEAVHDLFGELLNEYKDLAVARRIGSFEALISLQKELNKKANKISDLLENPMKQDWFLFLLEDLEQKARNSKC